MRGTRPGGAAAAARTVALALVVLSLAACSDDGEETSPEASAVERPDDTTTSTLPLATGREVATEQGPVVGTVGAASRSFLGIPYAAPPVGELRWADPEPPPPRAGPLDASEPGPACIQETSSASARISEDCLYLNVYTPNPPARDLPVMVWVHGGAFLVGQGYDYDARRLVADHDVVVVTINHRLGTYGYLAHEQLSEQADDGASGNQGLADQRAALAWLQENAAAFGGDPTNLTIFGQSSGGSSGCFQLLSPDAEGLVQQAILQSGVCGLVGRGTPSLEQGEASGAAIADALGCDPATALECLRAASPDELEAAVDEAGLLAVVAATPVVDGTSVPDQPAALLEAGEVLEVPVIVGSTRDEGTVFVYAQHDRTGTSLDAAAYPDALATGFGADRVDDLLEAYPLDAHPSPSQALAAARTDQLACTIDDTAQQLAEVVPTYQYEFADRSAPFSLPETPDLEIGAGHGSELPYLFHSLTYPLTARSPAELTPAQEEVSRLLTGAWTSFAADGDPNGPQLPEWEPVDPDDPEDDAVLVFDEDGAAMADGFRSEHRCDLWS